MPRKIKEYEANCHIKIFHKGKSARATIEHCIEYVSKFNLDLTNVRAYALNGEMEDEYEVQMQLCGPVKGSSKLQIIKKLVSTSKKLNVDIEDINIYET
mgnify:FL=1|tara:strand:- start:555 stop:851 length:297 start_codon:yes stop_codon:yes gene_type:complete